MACFRQHFRRCGSNEPRQGVSKNDISCGCVLDGEVKMPHHASIVDFVEQKLKPWAAKKLTMDERGLIGRLAKFQGKRNQEQAAVAAVLKTEGIVVNDAKIKCKKEWGVATLGPSFFGWVPQDGAEDVSGGAGGAVASGGVAAASGAAAASSGGGAAASPGVAQACRSDTQRPFPSPIPVLPSPSPLPPLPAPCPPLPYW